MKIRPSILLILSILLGLFVFMPTYAEESTIDLNRGSAIIDENYLRTNNIEEDDVITISSYTGNNTISVTATSQEVNMTLENVTIEVTSASACAFKIDRGSTVNLTLDGHSILKSANYKAGLGVPNGATLTIDKISGGLDDENTLTVEGGYQGAGIGGGSQENGGSITIDGGKIQATGNEGGAGIGGGSQGYGGTITINGAVVKAISTFVTEAWNGAAAAIGGGSHLGDPYGYGPDGFPTVFNPGGNGGTIKIGGGAVVYAKTVGNSSHAIGEGSQCVPMYNPDGSYGHSTLEITGEDTVVLTKNGEERTLDNGLYLFSASTASDIEIPEELRKLGVGIADVDLKYYFNAKSIGTSDITVEAISDQAYTGSNIMPIIMVKNSDITLVKDKDYTITYENNTNAGKATITLRGMGNYKGVREVNFNIIKSITASDITIEAIADQTYSGSQLEPIIIVRDHGINLVKDRDFSVTYENNTDIGQATVTVTGVGHYIDEITTHFNINKLTSGGSGSSGSSGSSSIPSSKPLKSSMGTESSNIGRVKTKTIEGVKTAQAQIDSNRLDRELKTVDTDSKMKIAVKEKAVDVKLDLKDIENMQDKKVVFEIATENEIYALDTDKIDVNKISEVVGESVDLDDIEVNVEIKPSSSKTKVLAKKIVSQKNLELISEPVDFNITAIHNGKTILVEQFNGMIERSIKIPNEINLKEVTTAVAIGEDGTLRPVPTHIEKNNGASYAVSNSKTDGTFCLVSNKKEYTDMENHWAKDDANKMAARLIFEDTEKFEPEVVITRKDMMKYLVKALGLKPDKGLNPFVDVSEEYTGYVGTAYEYGLIDGTSETTFSPNDVLTRQQAMALIYRAAKILGNTNEIHAIDMSVYADYENVSSWARDSIRWTVGSGIMKGVSDTELSPKSNLSKAEIAALLNRFLVSMKLID